MAIGFGPQPLLDPEEMVPAADDRAATLAADELFFDPFERLGSGGVGQGQRVSGCIDDALARATLFLALAALDAGPVVDAEPARLGREVVVDLDRERRAHLGAGAAADAVVLVVFGEAAIGREGGGGTGRILGRVRRREKRGQGFLC